MTKHNPLQLTQSYIEDRCIPEPNTGCWIWLGHIANAGYGALNLRSAPRMNAHRASYIAFNGPVFAGVDIDHLCRQPLCVNPDHLEAVTHQENCRRRGAALTHCKNGHPFGDAVDSRGSRRCRVCDADRSLRYRQKAAALASAQSVEGE